MKGQQTIPSFFIVGAPKAGTTALYHYLDQHPQIYMSPIKEPCYFASEVRPENFAPQMQPLVERDMRQVREYLDSGLREKRFGGIVADWEDYLKLFGGARDEKAIGEASVCYLWSETAAANIASRVPGARIIMVLRNPVERAFSQYCHAVTNGLTDLPFRKYVEASVQSEDRKFGPLYPMLEFGLYYHQVKRYLALFPRDRVKIHLYDDYRHCPSAFLRDVLAFLEVDASFTPDTSEKHLQPHIPRSAGAVRSLKRCGLWQLARTLVPSALRRPAKAVIYRSRASLHLGPEDRACLAEYYREDVAHLEGLLDRDLQHWL